MKLEDVYLCRGCAFPAHTTLDHKSNSFNKEREMINNLITHLKEEASEDAEHKGGCNTELTTNTQTRKEKTTTVENLHATVDELKASMENLAMEVTKLFAQVSHQFEVHEGMQRELQLMKDLKVSERILRIDIPSRKRIWSTKWCHRCKGAGVRPRFVDRQFRDTDWDTVFSGVPGLVVVRILRPHDLGVERSAGRLFCGVHEHTFVRYRIHQAAH